MAFVAVLAVLASCNQGPPSPAKEPAGSVDNVILISIDSLRADHLGTYGYKQPTSPTIDALAAEGLVFDRAYSTTSWTLPSHTALLTGLDDYAHMVRDNGHKLPEEIETLAETLRAAGIRTTGFFSGPYLQPSFGLSQGFERYINCSSYARDTANETQKALQFLASHHDVTNPILLRGMKDWIAEGPKSGRNFIFIHMWDVHYDYIAPKAYVDLFDPGYTGTLTGEAFDQNDAITPDLPARDLQHLLALYDAEIRYTDDTLGQLLSMLKAAGVSAPLAIIVLADHGEEFLDHGKKGHHGTLYEEVLKIPLIIHIEGRQPATARTRDVVSLIDLYPTICELFGVKCENRSPANSLMPYFDGENTEGLRNDALAELTVAALGMDQTALVRRDGKIIYWNGSGVGKYYREADLATEQNGVPVKDGAVGRASEAARSILEEMRRREVAALQRSVALYEGVTTEAPVLDDITREHLRSLGYME